MTCWVFKETEPLEKKKINAAGFQSLPGDKIGKMLHTRSIWTLIRKTKMWMENIHSKGGNCFLEPNFIWGSYL